MDEVVEEILIEWGFEITYDATGIVRIWSTDGKNSVAFHEGISRVRRINVGNMVLIVGDSSVIFFNNGVFAVNIN